MYITDIDSNMFLPYTDEGRDGEDDGGEGERHHEGDAVDHVAREVLPLHGPLVLCRKGGNGGKRSSA